MQDEQKKYIPVGTKVSPEAYELIKHALTLRGLTMYDYLQVCLTMLLSLMDETHNLSTDMQKLILIFEGIKNWDKCILLTDSVSKKRIQEAFYILTEPNKNGQAIVHVSGDKDDMFRTETWNKQQMLERFIELLMPELYKRLRLVGIEMGTCNLYDTLVQLVEETYIDRDATEVQREFEEAGNDWSTYGNRPAEQPYKRKQSTESQARKLFNND